MIRFSSYTLLTACLFLLYACANVGTPSGGPRDRTPPKVLLETPKNQTTHFSAKEFTIEFDEFIQLRNINEELIINPPLEKNPIVTNLGKSIRVRINNPLDSNTTYVFNFNNAIVDNNEGNALGNYQYAFSTGDYLDSLTFSGNVYNAYDLSIPENCFAILHRDLSDSALLNTLPGYVAKVDANGNFTFTFLASGKYRLYALTDKNNNFLYDQPGTETVGFYDSIIHVKGHDFHPHEHKHEYGHKHTHHTQDSLIDSIIDPIIDSIIDKADKPEIFCTHALPHFSIPLFLEEAPPGRQYIKTSERKSKEHILLVFSRTNEVAPTFQVENVSPDDYWISPSSSLDSFQVWLLDSHAIQRERLKLFASYQVEDSTGTREKTDTLTLLPPLRQRASSEAAPPTLGISHNANTPFPFFSDVRLHFNRPLAAYTDSLMLLKYRVDTLWKSTDFIILNPFTEAIFSNKLILQKEDWRKGEPYKFIFYPGAFIDMYGTTNDTLEVNFTLATEEMFGSLMLTISGNPSPVIVQLLGRNDAIAHEKSSANPLFPYVQPGTYKVKLILDENEDGEWSSGNLLQRKQPEEVQFYTAPLDIRGGWELEQSWELEMPE